jgi:hypothetical protein
MSDDTAPLLERVERFIRRYVHLTGDGYYWAVALWVLHTHAIGAADTTPRLVVKSPEKECGKTRLLEVLEVVVPGPLMAVNSTIAPLFRLIQQETLTILFDEVDTIFGTNGAREHEDLRALINAGHRRGATIPRMVGEGSKMHAERFPVFAAAALAAIGDLPDTVESRALILPMRRRAPDEVVEPFRRRRINGSASELKQDLAAWAEVYAEQLADREPDVPEGIRDRAADCWEPLLAIADLAGGPWPERARTAASFISNGHEAKDQSMGVRLLAAIRDVFNGDRMWSADLCAALNSLDEESWGGWNDGKGIQPRDLARRLRAFGVRSTKVRQGPRTLMGYLAEDLRDAFHRYLPVAGTSGTNGTAHELNLNDVPAVPAVPFTPQGRDTCPDCGVPLLPSIRHHCSRSVASAPGEGA